MLELHQAHENPKVALTETEVAELLSLKVPTLRAWRRQRKGPRFLKLGSAIRYLRSDVEAFMQNSAVE